MTFCGWCTHTPIGDVVEGLFVVKLFPCVIRWTVPKLCPSRSKSVKFFKTKLKKTDSASDPKKMNLWGHPLDLMYGHVLCSFSAIHILISDCRGTPKRLASRSSWLIVQRYTVPPQQVKFRVYRRGVDSGIWFQDFGQVTEQGRCLVGVDPLLLQAVEKELVEVGDHDTLFDATTSQPESNNRLKIYSAFDSLVRVIIAFLTSFPFWIQIESLIITSRWFL